MTVSGMRLPGDGRGRDGSELAGRRWLPWVADGRAVGVCLPGAGGAGMQLLGRGRDGSVLGGRRWLSWAVDGRAVGVWQRAGVPCAACDTWWSAAPRRHLWSRLSPCSTSSASRREEERAPRAKGSS